MASAKQIIVTLESGTNSEFADKLAASFLLYRGVVGVHVDPAEIDDLFAVDNVRRALGQKLLEVIYPKE